MLLIVLALGCSSRPGIFIRAEESVVPLLDDMVTFLDRCFQDATLLGPMPIQPTMRRASPPTEGRRSMGGRRATSATT